MLESGLPLQREKNAPGNDNEAEHDSDIKSSIPGYFNRSGTGCQNPLRIKSLCTLTAASKHAQALEGFEFFQGLST
jgi:hypothetical protein